MWAPRSVPGGRGAAAESLGILLTGGTGPSEFWSDAPGTFAALEAAGCSSIWLADHLFWGAEMPECLVMASVAAAATSRCAIGTGVLQLPLRRAAVVAKAAATLQALSGGRFVLGVGSGEHREEYDKAGADFEGRGAAVDASMAEMRELWAGSDDRFSQRPVPEPVPVWVGGRSTAALRRAARHADGWLPLFVTPDGFARANAELDRLLEAAGRPARSMARAVVAIVAPTGPERTRADALAWVSALWSMPADRLGRYLVSGSEQECATSLAAYRSAGADLVVVLVADDAPLDAFVGLNRAYRTEVDR